METLTSFEDRITNKNLTPLAKNFIIFIRGMAIENDKSTDEIWALWKDYSNKCACYDQSPVKSEFVQWYNLKATEGLLRLI